MIGEPSTCFYPRLSLFPAEPQFALKVLVLDSVTHQPLPGVSVSVYLNYSVTSSDQTEPSGEAVFWIRHRPQLALTLLADKRGYVPQALPWSSSRRPGEWGPLGGDNSSQLMIPTTVLCSSVLSSVGGDAAAAASDSRKHLAV